MSSIEERVVSMKFNNSQFQQGVQSTIGSLDKLKSSLNLSGAAKGLDGVSAASKNFSLAGIASGVDTIASKFSALSIVGITALTNIANKAVNAGVTLAKSLTIDPIKSGFDEYELKLGSIQTILANTSQHGTKLNDVTGALDKLNEYSDKTIYSFSDMTKNVGLFTNAGIKLEDATSMIKGFSNEAAASGTNAEQAAGGAYQLSQAMSAGKITLMDWRSLTNAGMGGANMKKGLTDIASAMGTFAGKGVDAAGVAKDFNGSLEKGWMTADVMQNYLKIQAGELSDKQMKALGLTQKQIEAFKKQSTTAQDAATKVKTFTQLMGTLKESVGSGWSQTFEIIFGDFEEAKKLWTGVNNALGTIIQHSANVRNQIIEQWDKKGGRVALIEGFKNAFKALGSVIMPIRAAFQEIFPRTTGEQLRNYSVAFRDFMKSLILGKESANNLKRTFKGVFAVFSIVWAVVKGIISTFFNMFNIVRGGAPGFLALTASVGDFLVKINDWLVKGGKIKAFFDGINKARQNVFGPIIKVVGMVAAAFGSLFTGDFSGFTSKIGAAFSGLASVFDGIKKNASNMLGNISKLFGSAGKWIASLGSTALAPIVVIFQFIAKKFNDLRNSFDSFIPSFDTISAKIQELKDKFTGMIPKFDTSGMELVSANTSKMGGVGDKVKTVWDGLSNALSNIGSALAPIVANIGEFFTAITDKVVAYIKGMSFQEGVALLNTGFFIALYIVLKKFVKSLTGVVDSASRTLNSITGVFTEITKSLKTMQQDVKANIILKIAIAVGILAGAVYLLSKIPADDLKKALIALSVMFVQLGVILVAFSKINTGESSLTRTSFGLILLAIAVRILASAVTELSGLDWEELSRGLIGVGGLLVALTLFSKFASADKGGASQGVGLVLLAVAIRILVSSVSILGKMDTGVLLKGIAALGVMLAMLAVIVVAFNNTKGLVKAAAAMLILSVALMALQFVMKSYAKLDWDVMLKGMAMIALTLGMLGIAMRAFPQDMPKLAAGLLIVAGALKIIAQVLKDLALMTAGDIVKSLITLNVLLSIIVGAMRQMEDTTRGALAMLVVSGALLVFTKVLQILASLDAGDILKGLGAIAAIFAILAVAGLAGPAIMILAKGVMLLGAAMALAGAGFMLFAGALAILGATGAIGFAVLTAGIMGFLPLIPLIAQQVGLGMIAVAKVMGDAGPVLLVALTKVLMVLIGAFAIVGPAAIKAFGKLLLSLLVAVGTLIPELVKLGFNIIVSLIKGIADNIKAIVVAALKVISEFLRALAVGLPEIVKAGIGLIVALINAITLSLPQIIMAGGRLIIAFLTGIIAVLPGMIAAGVKLIIAFLTGITLALPGIIAAGAKLIVAFLNGITAALPSILVAAANLIIAFLNGLAQQLPWIMLAATNLIVAFLDGIANAIPRIASSVADIIAALVNGIANNLYKIINAGANLITKFIEGIGNPENIKKILDAAAQTLLNFINGFSQAIDDHAAEIGTAVGKLAVALGAGLKNGLGAAMREVAKSAGPMMGPVLNKIADALGVKSPSTKTHAFGVNLGKGLANGMSSYSGVVSKQAAGVGHSAIDAMRKSISGMSDIVAADINSEPTIKPVLDLTSVQKDAGLLNSMLPSPQIAVGASYSKASAAAFGYGKSKASKDVPPQVIVQAPTSPRPVEYHIGTIQDGDSLLRRARANDKMLSLAEGGDSPQVVGVGI